jgi:hypothetical protein
MKKIRIIGSCFRWTARVAGGLTVLIFLAFIIGEGAPSYLSAADLPAAEIIMFIGLAAALIGLLISWRWKLTGCLLALAGYAVFSICDKKINLASPFSIFPIIAALYAIAWFFDWFSARPSGTVIRS